MPPCVITARVQAHLDANSDYLRPLAAVLMAFEMPWSASVRGDFEQRRSRLAAGGVCRVADYVEGVVQPLWSYWGLDARPPQSEATRQAQVQLRRYRAALRKFARREAGGAEAGMSDCPEPPAGVEPAT